MPTWTAEELGKRTSIERFFGRVLVYFRLQRPSVLSLVGGRGARGADLCGGLGRRSGRLQVGCPDFIRDLCTTLQSHQVACSDTLVIA